MSVGHTAVLDEVVLQELSSSEKTVVIDRGLLEKYSENTLGKFFVQAGDFHFPKIFLVAEGRLVKSFPKKSIWYMTKIYIPSLIKTKEHLLVLTSNQIKTGRAANSKQRHVVLSADHYDHVDNYREGNKNNVPDRLLQDSIGHDEFGELYDVTKNRDADFEIETYEMFNKKSGVQFNDEYNDESTEKYFIGNREVEVGNIENEEDKQLLDSLSLGLINRTEFGKYGVKGVFKNQRKDPGDREINSKISVTSVYENMKEEEKTREQIHPRVLAKMKRDGSQWSEDMNDETLRRYFIRTGIEHEERRRSLALNELDGNELMFYYSGSVVDHTTEVDQSFRGTGHNFGIGYDLHLSRTNNSLKNWSLQFIYERGNAYYNLGTFNAQGQESIYGVYLNYYLINNPLTINSFIILAGAGIKAGMTEMNSNNLTKGYSYEVLAIPAFQLMTKYRFRSGDLTEDSVNTGMSLNGGINIDNKNLSVIDSLSDNINGKISVRDIKYIIGTSLYF